MNAWQDPRIAGGMREQLARRRERIAAGEKPLGWKVGFGAPAALDRLKITMPLVGYLMAGGRLEPGAAVSLAGWAKPVAEPEIAVYMGRDLAGGADRDTVRAAIAAIGPAIELADMEFPPDDIERILTGNIYQRHVVLGRRDDSRAGARLDGLTARVTRRGAEVARTSDVQANIGEIVAIVQHVASVLAAFGERLRAGEIIITGSVVAPLFIEPGEQGVAYELDPIGGVSVRFQPT